MKAITVKYIGPTMTKGTRLKAFDCDGNQVTISRHTYDELDGEELYVKAALALVKKMRWYEYQGQPMSLVGGGTRDGYVFCFTGREYPCTPVP